MHEETIKLGDYIIIQKQNYKKLHKLNKAAGSVTLGKDRIYLTGVDGCRYSSIFKILPVNIKKREFNVELAEEIVDLKNEIDIKLSGTDNRNIIDDGNSQKLSAVEIENLKSDSFKASDIVETLISNSNTFHNKTEFSQEKYLKKKEKKYFEYLQILKPNLRIISEVMYKLDSNKIQNIRVDTLTQIMTLSNIHCEGLHLLYDSGSSGLLAAGLLSAIGQHSEGKLIHMHPGNMSQKQALLAMNFTEEHLNRCVSVNIYSVLRHYYQEKNGDPNENTHVSNGALPNLLKRKLDNDEDTLSCDVNNKIQKLEASPPLTPVVSDTPIDKSKQDDSNEKEFKKPKWYYENIAASELLQNKVDSLVIACKEDPQNIFTELLPFVKPGRPFIIYCSVAEPLQHLYMILKSYTNVAALRLTCNWMRNYQILPERTHPDVMMNGQSGFLLTGYVLK